MGGIPAYVEACGNAIAQIIRRGDGRRHRIVSDYDGADEGIRIAHGKVLVGRRVAAEFQVGIDGDGFAVGGGHHVVVVGLQLQVVGRLHRVEAGKTETGDRDVVAIDEIAAYIEQQGLTRILVADRGADLAGCRSEEHTSELQSHHDIVCRLLLDKKIDD